MTDNDHLWCKYGTFSSVKSHRATVVHQMTIKYATQYITLTVSATTIIQSKCPQASNASKNEVKHKSLMPTCTNL